MRGENWTEWEADVRVSLKIVIDRDGAAKIV